MLAGPIVVPDGDSFLETPMDVNQPGLPELPPLTWSELAWLHRDLELTLLDPSMLEHERMPITNPKLPELPRLDADEMAGIIRHIEALLTDP